jgi:hypothetical protein
MKQLANSIIDLGKARREQQEKLDSGSFLASLHHVLVRAGFRRAQGSEVAGMIGFFYNKANCSVCLGGEERQKVERVYAHTPQGMIIFDQRIDEEEASAQLNGVLNMVEEIKWADYTLPTPEEYAALLTGNRAPQHWIEKAGDRYMPVYDPWAWRLTDHRVSGWVELTKDITLSYQDQFVLLNKGQIAKLSLDLVAETASIAANIDSVLAMTPISFDTGISLTYQNGFPTAAPKDARQLRTVSLAKLFEVARTPEETKKTWKRVTSDVVPKLREAKWYRYRGPTMARITKKGDADTFKTLKKGDCFGVLNGDKGCRLVFADPKVVDQFFPVSKEKANLLTNKSKSITSIPIPLAEITRGKKAAIEIEEDIEMPPQGEKSTPPPKSWQFTGQGRSIDPSEWDEDEKVEETSVEPWPYRPAKIPEKFTDGIGRDAPSKANSNPLWKEVYERVGRLIQQDYTGMKANRGSIFLRIDPSYLDLFVSELLHTNTRMTVLTDEAVKRDGKKDQRIIRFNTPTVQNRKMVIEYGDPTSIKNVTISGD